jgi:hypothetical protein
MYKTIEQIHEDYDGNWVFIVNCQKDEYGSLVGGKVVLHSPKKMDVLDAMERFKYTDGLTSFRYAGKIPEGIVYVL